MYQSLLLFNTLNAYSAWLPEISPPCACKAGILNVQQELTRELTREITQAVLLELLVPLDTERFFKEILVINTIVPK